MIDNPRHPNSENNSLVLRAGSNTGLPSTELREVIPEFEEEIDLRDYIDVLIRRKWSVIIFLLVTFFTVAVYTFTCTPIFVAKGTLKISSKPSNVTKFENVEADLIKIQEFQTTQVNLLESEQLASRVIDSLQLTENPLFNPYLEAGQDDSPSIVGEVFAAVKNFIRFQDEEKESSDLDGEMRQNIILNAVLRNFRNNFHVAPVRDSELIVISFESPDARLSAQVVNVAMHEFLNMKMDNQMQISKTASKFLEKKIHDAQIKLEKSEKKLTEFSQKAGLVSLDPKLNLVMKQLEELNQALAEARTKRLKQEALYRQAVSKSGENMPRVLNDPLIQELKKQYAELKSQYEDMLTTFKPAYPKMQQLKAHMNDISSRIALEKKMIIDSIKNDYQTALKNEEYLTKCAEEQKRKVIKLNDRATQYKILLREVNTNKSIYQSLLQRSKEIEATLGAGILNMQIIDNARVPVSPDKPKIIRNLLLAIVLGLFGGIGLAFLQEYFDNTIKSPDELSDRFNIPVLGLIPYEEEYADNSVEMATMVYHKPRSPVSEAVCTALTSVDLSSAENPPRIILVSSILPAAGKSTFCSNAILSYLRKGERCLIVDCDMRKPSLHKIFGAGERDRGLSNLLTGTVDLKDVIRKTDYSGLHFISSGPLPPNPSELLSSKRMRKLLDLARNHYHHVILDAPPYQGFADILILSHMVDGVILVTVEGETPREGVKHFKRSILNVNGKILGAIINKSGMKKGYGYSSYGQYKYYAYQYDYKYGSDQKSD